MPGRWECRCEMTIYCGIDWAAHHHDVAIVNDAGAVLATRRIGNNAAGLTTLMILLAEHAAADAGDAGACGVPEVGLGV